ncbi:MAG: hypothetical protein AAGA91_03105 [Pseudomonadota bacterium]
MEYVKAHWAKSVALTTLLSMSLPVDAQNLYRYRNAEGNVVVDYQVPSEFVGSGYEVLNNEGVVLEVVPRELTAEERLAKDAEEQRQAAARAEEERLREWDESLMLRYSTVADIEDARERGLSELRIRLSILQSNRRSLKQQIENYQAQAANLERQGHKVDVERLQAIEDLQAEIEVTDRAIVERKQDIDKVSDGYQADIERFEMLLEVVELRRTMQARKSAE